MPWLQRTDGMELLQRGGLRERMGLHEHGHMWVGTDLSTGMLNVAAVHQDDTEGDLIHADMGHGFGFRAGMFDAAISISAL